MEIQYNFPNTKTSYTVYRSGSEIFLVLVDLHTVYFKRDGKFYRGYMPQNDYNHANDHTDDLAGFINECNNACQTECSLPSEIDLLPQRCGVIVYHNVLEETRIRVHYNDRGFVDAYFMRLPGIGIIYDLDDEPVIQHGHSGLEMDVTKAEPVNEQLYMVIKTLLV